MLFSCVEYVFNSSSVLVLTFLTCFLFVDGKKMCSFSCGFCYPEWVLPQCNFVHMTLCAMNIKNGYHSHHLKQSLFVFGLFRVYSL